MTTFWQTLIEQSRQHPEVQPKDDALQISPLNQLSIIEVTGDDASTFLQNLFTNDISTLAIGDGHYSGFCNPKGRLFAYFLVIRRQSTCFQLILPTSVCEAIVKRLTMYVLRSKVTVADRSQDMVCLGLLPPNKIDYTGLDLDESLFKGKESNDRFTVRLPSHASRWLLILPASAIEAYLTTLGLNYELCQTSLWELDDIESGLAKVTAETQEKFTPQQLNLDLNNSVSFNKGCYPGQEVVARLHYLGKPSRRLFKAIAATDSDSKLGSEIITDEGKVAGHIVNIHNNHEHTSLLLSVKLSEIEAKLQTDDGVKITELVSVHNED